MSMILVTLRSPDNEMFNGTQMQFEHDRVPVVMTLGRTRFIRHTTISGYELWEDGYTPAVTK